MLARAKLRNWPRFKKKEELFHLGRKQHEWRDGVEEGATPGVASDTTLILG